MGRLRAKVDMNSEPQRYAKDSMIVATAALFVQVLGILLPHWPERANVPPGTVTGPWLYKWFKIILEYGMVIALAVCIVIMSYSIFTIRFESTREELIEKTLSKPPRNPNPAGEDG